MALSQGHRIMEKTGKVFTFPVAANAQVWAGGLFMLDTGVGKPAATGGTSSIASHYVVVGVAEESVTGGAANGDVSCRVRGGVFNFNNSSGGDAITLQNVGAPAYAVDDQT